MISSAWFFALEGRWSLKDEWNYFQGQSRNFQYRQLLLTSQGLQPRRRSSPWPSPPWGCNYFFCTRDTYLGNLVNVVFVRENVEHAKHLVQGRHNLHAVALLADVPESFIFLRLQNGEVSWQMASHPKTGMSLKTMVTISKTSQVSTAEAPFWTKKSFFSIYEAQKNKRRKN